MATILNLVIATTVTAAVILLLKAVLGSKITPRGHMLLWLVFAVQIACVPLADLIPESELAARSYLPQLSESTSNIKELPDTKDYAMRGTVSEEMDSNFSEDAYKQTLTVKKPFSGESISKEYYVSAAKRDNEKLSFMLVWGIGTAIVIGAFISAAAKQKRKVNRLTECSDSETLSLLDELRQRAGIKESCNIRIKCGSSSTFLTRLHCVQSSEAASSTEHKSSPLYLICMEDGFSSEEKRQVIAHELTHLLHGDLWLNLISALFIAVFWWNPVMWLAFRRFRRDMEVYCDYDAARLTNDKKEYARTLVKAASADRRFVLGTTSFIGGKKEAAVRVKALAAFKKPKAWIVVLAAVVLCVGCVCLVLNPRSSNECTKYFDSLRADDIENVFCLASIENSFDTDEFYISEKSEIKQLVKLLHSFKAEEFSPSESSDMDLKSAPRLSVYIKDRVFPIAFYRAEEAGEDVYYISCGEYEEGEIDDAEAVNGMYVTSAKLTELLENYISTNLHMDFWGGFLDSDSSVSVYIQNSENGNAEPLLEYDNSYRIEKYIGEEEYEHNKYEYDAKKWMTLEAVGSQSDENNGEKTVITDKEPQTLVIDFSGKYGKPTEAGVYRVVKTFTQKLKDGSIVTKEKAAEFSWCENELHLENWDLLLEQPEGELDEAVVAELQKTFSAWRYDKYNTNTLYCFFTSEYESPEKLNFLEFLRYYPYFDSFKDWTPELKAEFEASEFWKEYREAGFTVDNFMTPVKLYRPEVINEGLMYYAGITLDEIRANYSEEKMNRCYVKELDRFVTFTSDAGGGLFIVKSGKKEGDTVTLLGDTDISYQSSDKWESKNGTAELILKEKDGRYIIQSYLVKEEHGVDAFYQNYY